MLKINTSGKRHTTDTKLVRRIACEDKFATLQRLKTSISGLQTKDARQRLAKNGPNEIVNKPKNTRLQFLCEAFMTPFTSILLGLAIVSIMLNYKLKVHNLDTPVLIILVLAISGILSFIQNIKIRAAIQNLLHKISPTTKVMRDCMPQELATKELVAGDIILLQAGEVVPADVRILKNNNIICSADFFMDEDNPVYKSEITSLGQRNNHGYVDYANILYAGTRIISGSGVGVVFATGKETIFGKLSQNISKMELKKHVFNLDTRNLTRVFLILAAVIVPLFLVISSMMHGNWENTLVFALAVVVGLTSDAVPISITSQLLKNSIYHPSNSMVMKKQNQSN